MSFKSDRLRGAFLASAAVSMMVTATPATAQARIQVNLPAQDLSSSLRQLALQTGKEILFAPALVANRKAPALSGVFSTREAIVRLVAPFGLVVEEPTANVFVLKRAPAPQANRTAQAARPGQAVAASYSAPRPAPARAAAGAQAGDGTGVVSGVVLGPDNLGVAGAIVRVEGTDLSTVTDANGGYRIAGVPAGDQVIVLEYLGDEPQTLAVSVAPREETQVALNRNVTRDIVVRGYIGSIQRSLNQQKNSPNSATVVSADLLGQFPAETVSEALRRVPGVGFGRSEDTGEGSRITVRGFTSEAIQVQLNGLALQGTNHERTIDLSGYLADNISEIRIEKSLLPSHESSGSGGLVKIETKSGLDYGDLSASLGIEGEGNFESRFGSEWQANGTFAWKPAPNFGIAVSVAYRDTNRINYDAAVIATTPPVQPAGFMAGAIPASRDFPYDPEINKQLITSVSYTRRQRDEQNLLASLNLAWELGDHTRLRLDVQRNERDALNITPRATLSFVAASYDMPIPELNNEVRRRTVLETFRPTLSLFTSDQRLRSDSISLRGTTRLGSLTLDYKAGWAHALTKSDNSNILFQSVAHTNLTSLFDGLVIHQDDDAARTRRVVDGGFVLLPNGLPVPALNAAGQAALVNPANYTVPQAAPRTYSDNPTTAWTGQLDAKYDFGGFLDYLKVGVKYDRSDRQSADDLFPANVTFLTAFQNYTPIAGRPTTLADLGSLYFPDSLAMIGGSGLTIPFLYDGPAFFDRLAGLTADNPATPFNEQRFTFNNFLDLDPILSGSALDRTKTRETTWAGYLEAHFKLGDFDMTGGARYERVSRTGNALTTPSVTLVNGTGEPRQTFVNAGLVGFDDLGGTVDTITPSVVINYRPTSNLVARLHYNMSTTPPDIRMIRRTTQVVIDLRPITNRATIREANPDLKAQTVHNFEIGLARYFDKPAGVISVNGFYKKTNNNFTNVLISDVTEDSVRQRIVDFFGPLAQSRPDLVAFNDATLFYLSRPRNGEGGSIWGFEAEIIKQLDFLPGFFKDFGVSGNVTYTTGDFPVIVQGRTDAGALANFTLNKPLAEASEWVYNASLHYASGGFEGRVIYTHQEASVPSAGYNANDLNTIIPAYSTLDMRLSYTAKLGGGPLVTFFLEGDDLLRNSQDADIRRGIGPAFDRTDADYFFPGTFQFNGGRSITLGLRAQF